MPTPVNLNPSTITIATTIAPASDLINQLKAIDSWLALGFQVIAVNTPDEVNAFSTFFPGIKFVPTTRNAGEEYGRPYIFFDDLLNCLKDCGSQICGIVNSDIHLLHPDLPAFAYGEALNTFLFGSRIDIVSFGALDQGEWYDGFDYFFFHKNIIDYYPKEDFCIGLPWWDFWAVLIPLLRGVEVKKLISPVAYHLRHHPGHLYTGAWMKLGFIFAKYAPPPYPLTEETMAAFNNFALNALVTKVCKVLLPDSPKFLDTDLIPMDRD